MFRYKKEENGFTLVELTVVIALSGIAAIIIFTVFNTSFLNYLGLQQDSSAFDNLTRSSQRIATVFRGITDITVANNNDLTFYSYFSPNDTYVSYVRYYVAGPKPSLYADVTPMDGNPPNGSLLTAKSHTYTIIENFHQDPLVKTFEYLDSSGVAIPQPIADLHTIKGIQVNLSIVITGPKYNDIRSNSLTVSLRNRKTNL
ncbi:MAG: prepilin-type N-terminal cleavage/methylation domain-containing protein [Candidatus Saccharibacteria bacterium]|nr:prepilin-type N-terminal cleavage/methylation domain-containing protein [Candidatus Saccharibacteria bacterium]